MLAYTVRRFLGLLPALFVIITLSFFLVRLAPGGPFDQERALPPQVRANLDRVYGLDQPLALQYVHYLSRLARGDLGPSFKLRDFSVSELIAAGLPVSATLGALALLGCHPRDSPGRGCRLVARTSRRLRDRRV